MINIESTMEKIARVYSGKDVDIKFGPNFATDAKHTIYVPPISDQADPWVRFETEVSTYHEMGHIRRYKNKATKRVYDEVRKDLPLHKVFNAIEDVSTDGELLHYPGIKMKQAEFLTKLVDKDIRKRFEDPAVPTLKKILDYTYLRAKEYQLDKNFKVALPQEIKSVWDRVVGDPLAKTIAEERDPEKIRDISQRIFNQIKDLSEQEPQPQNGAGNDGDESEDSEEQDSSGGSSGDGSKSGTKKDNKRDKGSDSKKSGKNSDSKSGSQSDSSDSGDASGDQESESSGSDKSSGSSTNKDGSAGSSDIDTKSSDKRDSDSGSDSKDRKDSAKADQKDKKGQSADSRVKNKQIQAAKDLLKDLSDADSNTTTVNDDVQADVHTYLDKNHVYREATGLKENFYRQNSPDYDVSHYEKEGRILTGYIGAKLRTLLISDRAPRWFRCQRSGRLDVKRLWNDNTDAIYKKKLPARFEDSAVFMVMDNSGSMGGTRIDIATKMMTSLAAELDRLRVPFAAAGFTSASTGNSLNTVGVRTEPSTIQIIKTFDEPYRRTAGRFRPPSISLNTVEFPCIRFGAEQLARRRETKKVLFVFSDGRTESGVCQLDNAMRKAMKDYVKMLIRSEIYVVGFELLNDWLQEIIPTTIHIGHNDLANLPSRFYKELLDILLFKKGMASV